VIKIYLFVLFNIITIGCFGGVMNLLGTANTMTVYVGIVLLLAIPFVYVQGLKQFGYWESIKNKLLHWKDILSGDLH